MVLPAVQNLHILPRRLIRHPVQHVLRRQPVGVRLLIGQVTAVLLIYRRSGGLKIAVRLLKNGRFLPMDFVQHAPFGGM